MEGGRMAFPVFREFYKERDVVYEERRMRTESTPIGRLFEQYTQAAYVAHPYGYGVIGFPSDLSTFTRTEGEQFYRGHYVAKNMAVAVVGDVSLADLKGMATKYWEDVSSAPAPPELDVKEPEQKAERRVILEDPAQPYVVIGWHCPAFTDPRFPAYDALADLLGGGDYSRLYKRLVKEKKICVQAAAFTGYPGQKYPGLLSIIAVPASGQDPLAVEREVYATLDEIQKSQPFTDEELTGYKVRTRADLVHQCEDNQSLASALAEAQILYGDWHEFFRGVERVQKLAPRDLLEAMKASLTRENRTVALIENPKPESSTPTGGGR
jgi:predicted Zn-dependent peptidase